MARTIYDKPTRALLKDMLKEWGLKPGQVFTIARAVEWFAKNYPQAEARQYPCALGPGGNE